ncbi:complex I assembly factor ACAD9, mitochondrial [Belonocnema kinseyi]|uniref:complex I assembly factor ACAD9, mitochondrial n=1 Tax=Belonocnema kinseyi TaxID=2817044 RepID=UPI00143D925E|nr:complex I assembly factor ACAD9, mitochondrial [Belonocnema kinseyi]
MLTRRVALLQQYSCLKSVYSRKATEAKVNPSDLAFPAKTRLPIPKPKSPKRDPFVKEFFIGKFDNEILAYPEPQTDERHREFSEWLKPIQEYIKTVDAKTVYESPSFSAEMRERLKELGVYGGRISYDYDGIDLLDSEYLKLVETLSVVPKVGMNLITTNNFPVELLKKSGTVEQKYQYLRQIASGHYVPVTCANESEYRVDPEKLFTTAVLSDDETYWSLSGQKTFIQQDNNANLFIVYARGQVGGDRRKLENTISAFIVDKNSPGVGECIPVKSPWLGSDNMFAVKFDNVKVPYGNLIGQIGDGVDTLEEYFLSDLVFSAGVYIGILKNYLNALIKNVINNGMYDRESVQSVISRTAGSLYAMESVAYLTTGLSDLYEGQDLRAEKIIAKEFCSRECIERLQEGFRLLDTHICMGTYPLEHVMRNHMFGMQGDADLKTYAGLLGIKYAGSFLGDYVKKSRNPLEYPQFVIKKLFGIVPDFKRLYLEENLHPSYQTHAHYLEEAFGRMDRCTRLLLVRYGAQLMTHEMDVQRLSEMTSLIYVVTALFGRASRAYCIGLRNADYDMKVASAFAYKAWHRIEFLGKEIEHGDYLNGNMYHKEVSQRLYEMKNYCLEHPLERNW